MSSEDRLADAPVWFVTTRRGQVVDLTREDAERHAQALRDQGEPDVYVNFSDPFEDTKDEQR